MFISCSCLSSLLNKPLCFLSLSLNFFFQVFYINLGYCSQLTFLFNHQDALWWLQLQQPRIPTETTVTTRTKTTTSGFMRRLFVCLFFSHLILIAALVIFLAAQGLRSGIRRHQFRPTDWYYPLLASIGCAAILSLVWQWITSCSPGKAFKSAFWLAPLSTCAVAVLLLTIGSSADMVAGIAALLCSFILSLYGCWVSPRFEYAIRVLTVSSTSPPAKAISLVTLSMLISILYCCLLVVGIGGAKARKTNLDLLFISIILLSLAWTLQVIRNTLLATITRVKYMYLACGIEVKTSMAFRDTLKHLMGSICIGSFLVPILGLMWGSARAMRLVAGGSDEFLFSCANCYAGCASTLVMYGNRWGFVHVGVYNKGFMQASMDVWEMFRRIGLEALIYSDLTGSFCFLSGVAVGGICSLVSGIWALAVHKSYATELSLYAFFIGYLMSRIAMAWQQACLTAYYVAYAENPQSSQFDSTIPARIQELQRLQA